MFVALEGVDAVGKATQVGSLIQYFRTRGVAVETIAFPQYGAPSAYFVEEYLKGGFGSAQSIDPRTASVFYALDRYAASRKIREWLAAGVAVVADRYVGSNLAHQGGKLSEAELRRFVEWDIELEFNLLCIPRPCVNLILWVPVEVSLKRLALRGNLPDEHEKSVEHLRRASEVYCWLAEEYPSDFALIECVVGEVELSPEEVHNKVLSVLRAREIVE